MNVNEIMHPGADWIDPDKTLEVVACKMREDDVGSIPVVENDRLVGMITDRDIVIRALAEGRDIGSTRVRDIMTGEMHVCHEDTDIEQAAGLMKDHKVRRLAVLNQSEGLAGMVSIGDVTAASRQLAGETLRELSAVGD